MEKIVRTTNKRILVFIDDLDRCSPKTTLEVFESIKAFLDICKYSHCEPPSRCRSILGHCISIYYYNIIFKKPRKLRPIK